MINKEYATLAAIVVSVFFGSAALLMLAWNLFVPVLHVEQMNYSNAIGLTIFVVVFTSILYGLRDVV